MVWGPPGTGKTTYLAHETDALVAWARKFHPERRKPVLVTSLTRSSAAEIAGRDLPLPKECVGTLHGHAYRALGAPPVAESRVKEFNERHPLHALQGAAEDADEPDWDRRLDSTGGEASGEYQLLRARMVDRKLWPAQVRSFAAAWEGWKDEAGLIDFTDMIELALRDVPQAGGEPLVLIADEAQDLSALEFALLRKWGAAAGRLIITGDPYQALYTWRGAHPEIFLDPSIPDQRRRVLNQSWRVPRAVHAAAMTWVKMLSTYRDLDYRPREELGRVSLLESSWRDPTEVLTLAEKRLDAGQSVMIAASCSFLLSPTVAMLRQAGLPFSNPWRRHRGDWNPLAHRGTSMARRILDYLRPDASTFGADHRLWTWGELRRWTEVLKSEGLLLHGAKAAMEEAKERDGVVAPQDLVQLFEQAPMRELFAMLARRLPESALPLGDAPQADRSPAGLMKWWKDRLLSSKRPAAEYPSRVLDLRGAAALDGEPRLFVGTIHSFKGAEADCVILYPDLSPAGWREWSGDGAERDGVIRTYYVGITRAREELIVVTRASGMAADIEDLVQEGAAA